MLNSLTRFRTGWRNLLDPDQRRRRAEVARDVAATRKQVGDFINQGRQFEQGRGDFAVLSQTSMPLKLKFYSLLAKRMQLEGYRPVMLSYGQSDVAGRYFDLFGFEQQHNVRDFIRRPHTAHQIEQAVRDLMPAHLSVYATRQCCYGDVPVGTYALSSASRVLQRLPPDLNEPEFTGAFARYLKTAISTTLAAEQILDRLEIRKILLRDIGYAVNGPFVDVALRRGVDCLVVADAQRAGCWVFKRYTPLNRFDHEFSISHQAWRELQHHELTAEMDRQVTEELAARYQADSLADKRRLQSGKATLSPQETRELLGLDPEKKTAVVFAHVSWDGAFFFGEDLFSDFDEWLLETTRAAIANPHLNWLIKLHPLNVLLHAFDGRSEFEAAEMSYLNGLGQLPAHVKILPSDTPINTSSLFPIIDYGLTVRGTIGLELPCLGVPVLTAGTGRYEGRGFTIDSVSREEYLNRLARLHETPPLSAEGRRLARLHYYYLMLHRQVSFKDIAPMTVRQRNEADSSLFNNIEINARSLDDIRRAHSLTLFADWAHRPDQPDLFEER